MCGIVGILNSPDRPASAELVRKMTDAVRHRGPDGEGVFTDGCLGLGHRRLAVIDLTPAADEPMATADGRYVISYNGEVYNFQELRNELKARGCRFRSRSDAEVVLYAWAEWGPAALDRFNGVFAFAVWDARQRRLFLARDRYGVKPLYWTVRGGTLLFGSEIKAILAHPAYRTELDREALIEYFTFQNFFTDRTLFKDVRLFPAGCWMRAGPEAVERPELTRYWDWDFAEPERPKDRREYTEELDRLMVQAVERQLVSDVPVGSYLSGGMDSGTITSIAAAQLPYMRTFTCGFDLHSASGLELGFDERERAELMSHRFKTEHYEVILKAGDMERVMAELAWHVEEPRVGQSYPNYYVARLASKFVKVVLSGAGGDELFGGYPWRYYRAVVNDDFDDYVSKYYVFWQRLLSNTLLRQVLRPVWTAEDDHLTIDIFRGVFQRHAPQLTRPEDYVNHSLYFEAKTFLHGLLIVDDKLSMAHGLETRVPFLDNDLVDFAMKVPVALKLRSLGKVIAMDENEPGLKNSKYFQKTHDGKRLLRAITGRRMHRLLKVSKSAKQGFSAPDASWFKGESIDYVRDTFYDNPQARLWDYMDRPAVRRVVKEHLDGRTNRRLLIWSLLSFEHWLRRFA